MVAFVFFLLLLLLATISVQASSGDRSENFRSCLYDCFQTTCPPPAHLPSTDLRDQVPWSKQQTWYLKLLMWECEDECKYSCMWKVVEIFQVQNYSVPQFYGKWPFIRLLGIQEPASTISSVLNGLAHCFMLQKFVQNVPSTSPTYRLWCVYAVACMNAWFWSAVFHTRDFPFTEKMDYFCALSGVLFSFYAFIIRMIGHDKLWKWILPGVACAVFYVNHVYYLAFVHFDYGYNMLANVTIGILNAIGWLLFCAIPGNDRSRIDLWPCAVSVLCVLCLMMLELLDFPPFFWTFDAHSLWHFGTVPITFLWYRFLIEDSVYLARMELQKTISKRQ